MTGRTSVLICALPRTGSSLLGELLYATGLVGYPAEWFWREDRGRNGERWQVTSFADYLARVLEAGTSPNGVFAAKLMWGYLDDVLFELRRLARSYDAEDAAVLQSAFPDPRFVWVRREDAVAQAVSWAKAVQTGQWRSDQQATAEPRSGSGDHGH